MKTLINNIVAFLRAATSTQLNTAKIFKGFSNVPELVPIEKYPYVAVDDGGERTEDLAKDSDNRFFSVLMEMAVLSGDLEKAMDDLFDLFDEVKTEFEKEVNRQKDGHIWAITTTPFEGNIDNNQFYRGRVITVDFMAIEFRPFSDF